jgi:hypothetical protein
LASQTIKWACGLCTEINIESMKTLAAILMILMIYPPTVQCDRCIGTGFGDCAESFSFRIVNKITQQDLVFGRNRVYDPDSVYLFTTRPSYPGRWSSVDSNRFLSLLPLPLDTFFLYLTSADTDTLLIKYDYVKAPCCRIDPGHGKVLLIIYNGIAVRKQGDIFELPK